MKKSGIFQNLKYDLPAGMVVYLVALPLCLGIGLASTGNPQLIFSGIIAGIVGGVVIGSLSGSALGVSGPAAGLVTIVFAAINDLGSFEAFLLAVVFAGFIQLLAGFLKAGIIGYYFPSSVIKGMLAAIGIILILKEIPHLLGYDEDYLGDLDFAQLDGHNTFTEVYYSFLYPSPGAIVIGLFSMALLILFEQGFMKKIKLFKFLPGALFVVLIGSLMNYFFSFYAPTLFMEGKHLVQLPVAKNPEEFFSFFRLPDFDAFTNTKVYVVALTIAVVASLETLLSVEATDKLDPYKRTTPTNRELKAQGIGNILSGMIGGLPITQVIVRSSTNITAGGKTKLSAVFHGFILLVSVAFVPGILNYIPLASLAAILLLIGYKLAKPTLFRLMFKLGWEQFVPFVVTIIAVVSTDLLRGIGIGVAVAIFYILRKNYRNPYTKQEHDGGKRVVIELAEEVSFLNKASISQVLGTLEPDTDLVIDGSQSKFIAYDVIERIYEFKEFTAPSKNINVSLIDITEDKTDRGKTKTTDNTLVR
ncbi:MAG: SulP family inorganic anion transporter [Brumimicrobium sp.]|nr:SulP family inorganic anion transporter [Brumimicrobium sp.]